MKRRNPSIEPLENRQMLSISAQIVKDLLPGPGSGVSYLDRVSGVLPPDLAFTGTNGSALQPWLTESSDLTRVDALAPNGTAVSPSPTKIAARHRRLERLLYAR